MDTHNTMKPTVFCGLLALGALLFGANIWGYDVWAPDEPRFAQAAREMIETGDPLVLRVNGEPYLEKPPALIWGIAAAALPLGDVTPWAARLPSVFGALLVLGCTVSLANRLYGPRTGWWAGLVLMTSLRFWWQTHTAQTDMLLAGTMAAALWAAWRWHETRRWGWLLVFWGAMTAGLYVKGPPALLFPLLLIFTFYWGRREDRRAAHWLLGVIAGLLLLGLWAIPARMAVQDELAKGAATALGNDLWRQIVGRVFLGVSKANWPWYYLIELPIDWLPWSLFLPWTLLYVWRNRREGEGMRFLLSWTVPAFVIFSIIIGKRAQYLLPLAPAIAILIARSLEALLDSGGKVLAGEARLRKGWLYAGGAALLVAVLFDPAAVFLTLLGGSLFLPFESERRRAAVLWGGLLCIVAVAPFVLLATRYAHAWRMQLLALTLVAGGFGLVSLTRGLRGDVPEVAGLMFKQFFLVLLTIAFFVFPVINTFKSAKPFCAPVRELAEAGEDFRLYSVAFIREEYLFYSHHRIREALIEPPELPEDIDPLDALRTLDRLRRDISKAAESLEVGSVGELSEDELAQLRGAIHKRIDEDDKLDPGLTARLEPLFRETVQGFVDEFVGGGPAFAYVQRADWLWLRALAPTTASAHIVKTAGVGSREVVLAANPEGQALLQQK